MCLNHIGTFAEKDEYLDTTLIYDIQFYCSCLHGRLSRCKNNRSGLDLLHVPTITIFAHIQLVPDYELPRCVRVRQGATPVHIFLVDSHLNGLPELLKVKTLHPNLARARQGGGTTTFTTAAACAAFSIGCNSERNAGVVGQNRTTVDNDCLIRVQFLRHDSA